MKKGIGVGIAILVLAGAAAVGLDDYHYRQSMEDVEVIHYITGSGSRYSTVYLTAVVPMDSYRGGRTIRSIRKYAIHRAGAVPDTLQIVLYDSLESLSDGESYCEVTFRE